MNNAKIRHILGISGGKDSTALAVLLHNEIPDMEYFFCDTHKELPETYEYLERIKACLGIDIKYLSDEKGFDYWLDIYGGFLPSAMARWCTKQLKLLPLEKFIGEDEAISYVGIRADENRSGYISTKPNIKAVYPFKERGFVKEDIIRILEESGIGLPDYYRWRSRSGCFFCFFQRKIEWIRLSEEHPNLFEEALKYEREHDDGRIYTWSDRESLLEMLKRKDEIIAEHEKEIERLKDIMPGRSLAELFAGMSDEEDGLDKACLICKL